MKVCQHCQTEIKKDNLFCSVCGEKYDSEKISPSIESQKEASKVAIGEEDLSKNEREDELTTSEKDQTTAMNNRRRFNWSYILLIIVGVGIGIGATYFFTKDEANPVGTEEVKTGSGEVAEKGNVLKTAGKEEISVSEIADEAVQVISATADGLAYDLYILQKNVTEEDSEIVYAKEGDVLESSDIVFYLAEQGADVAYYQEQVEPFEFMRNLTSESWSEHNWYEELRFPDYSLVAFYQYFDLFSYREVHLFDVIDGEVVEVNVDDFRYSWYYPLTKAIEEDKIQLVILEESSEDRWFFDTYEYERDQATMHFYNERSFDKFDVFEYTIADVIFEYWEKHDDAYLPYTKENDKKIWDLKSVVKNAEDGRLGDISAKVGDGMTSVYEQNKAFGDIGVIGGAMGTVVEIYYDTYIVGYEPADPNFVVGEGELDIDFYGTVNSFQIPGDYTNFTIEDVEMDLGSPDTFVDSDETIFEDYYYGYNMGDYTLTFVVDSTFDEIIEVMLFEWGLREYLNI